MSDQGKSLLLPKSGSNDISPADSTALSAFTRQQATAAPTNPNVLRSSDSSVHASPISLTQTNLRQQNIANGSAPLASSGFIVGQGATAAPLPLSTFISSPQSISTSQGNPLQQHQIPLQQQPAVPASSAAAASMSHTQHQESKERQQRFRRLPYVPQPTSQSAATLTASPSVTTPIQKASGTGGGASGAGRGRSAKSKTAIANAAKARAAKKQPGPDDKHRLSVAASLTEADSDDEGAGENAAAAAASAEDAASAPVKKQRKPRLKKEERIAQLKEQPQVQRPTRKRSRVARYTDDYDEHGLDGSGVEDDASHEDQPATKQSSRKKAKISLAAVPVEQMTSTSSSAAAAATEDEEMADASSTAEETHDSRLFRRLPYVQQDSTTFPNRVEGQPEGEDTEQMYAIGRQAQEEKTRLRRQLESTRSASAAPSITGTEGRRRIKRHNQRSLSSAGSTSASVKEEDGEESEAESLPPTQRLIKRPKSKTLELSAAREAQLLQQQNQESPRNAVPERPARQLINGKKFLDRDRLRMVFTFLGPEDIVDQQLDLVCQHWHQVLTTQPVVWRVLYVQTFYHKKYQKHLLDQKQIKGFSNWRTLFLQRYGYMRLSSSERVRELSLQKIRLERELDELFNKTGGTMLGDEDDNVRVDLRVDDNNLEQLKLVLFEKTRLNDFALQQSSELSRQQQLCMYAFYRFIQGYDLFDSVNQAILSPASATSSTEGATVVTKDPKRETTKRRRAHFRFLTDRHRGSIFVCRCSASYLVDPAYCFMQSSQAFINVVVFGRLGDKITFSCRVESRVVSPKDAKQDGEGADSKEPNTQGKLSIRIPEIGNRLLFEMDYSKRQEDSVTIDFEVLNQIQNTLRIKKPLPDDFMRFVFVITLCAATSPLFKSLLDKIENVFDNWASLKPVGNSASTATTTSLSSSGSAAAAK